MRSLNTMHLSMNYRFRDAPNDVSDSGEAERAALPQPTALITRCLGREYYPAHGKLLYSIPTSKVKTVSLRKSAICARGVGCG